jgi:hypothetical protein
VVDQETFKYLLPQATAWARKQEQLVLENGLPLGPQQISDARRAGVQDCSRVRVLVVDRIPLPDDQELAGAARLTNIITDASRGVAIGHGIMIRADCWGDRALLIHQLVHVAQCERSGGLEQWVNEYLGNRRNCANFTIGSLEQEARTLASEIVSDGADASVISA